MVNGIPVLVVRGNNIPDVWERSLLLVDSEGCDIKTQYDKPEDPPSKDCTMTLVINTPLNEPMIHRCFPADLESLNKYVNQLIYGDSALDNSDTYTYHKRLFDYDCLVDHSLPCAPFEFSIKQFNQIDEMCKQLAKVPYTRRAQAVVWKAWEDVNREDPPCVQRVWCRLTPWVDVDRHFTIGMDVSEDVDASLFTCGSAHFVGWTLNMDVTIRSNDAYRAAFMNLFAFVRLQCYIAKRIWELRSEPVAVGRFVWFADSYHIYGSTMEDFKKRFLKNYVDRKFEDRTWNSNILDVGKNGECAYA